MDDELAFSDQDLLNFLAQSPQTAMIDIDRELVDRGGLRAFIELAWHTVEGEGTFQPNWHIDEICEELEAVLRGEQRRLAIAIPPRHMKSLICSVFFIAYAWIKFPHLRFLTASYSYDLSVRDSVKCRRVIQSPWYQARWGHIFKLTGDQNTKERFENDAGGYRLATSVEGKLTGEGGDIIVVDDAHNVRQAESEAVRESTLQWWDEAMSTRLNDPKTGVFIIIMQRVHENDLIGHVLRKKSSLSYKYLCLPAEYEHDHPNLWHRDPRKVDGELLWPKHVPQESLDEIKSSLGAYASAGQLQQRPAPREGGIFKRSWFPKISPLLVPSDLRLSRAWDLAATEKKLAKADPDYTATALVGFSPSQKKFYIVEIQRWREDAGAIRRIVHEKAKLDGKNIKQTIPKDPGQAGKDQSQEYAVMLAGWPVMLEPQSGSKIQRAMPLAAQASSGNVYIVDAVWNDDFLLEITSAPNGAHDDMMDAVSSAFNRLTDGATGIIDFYENMKKEKEAEVKEDMKGPVRVIEEDTTNLARALLGYGGAKGT